MKSHFENAISSKQDSLLLDLMKETCIYIREASRREARSYKWTGSDKKVANSQQKDEVLESIGRRNLLQSITVGSGRGVVGEYLDPVLSGNIILLRLLCGRKPSYLTFPLTANGRLRLTKCPFRIFWKICDSEFVSTPISPLYSCFLSCEECSPVLLCTSLRKLV